MKYASVCSGVEAASLAWMPLGWEAAWFSEIEPFPCEVLKQRYPDVPNLGDMTKIKVENLENGDQKFTNENGTNVVVSGGVDLLVGGTPCFVEDTLVLTPQGYRKIQDLKIGDEVISHLGNVCKVTATGNKQAKVGTIKISGREKITCTDNHPFYVSSKKKSFEFVEAKDCKNKYAGRIHRHQISNTNIDELHLQVGGWFIGCGQIENDKIVFYINSKRTFDLFTKLFENKFDYFYDNNKELTRFEIQVEDKQLNEKIISIFSSNGEKIIPYSVYFNKYVDKFVSAYLNAIEHHSSSKKIYYENESLALSFADLFICHSVKKDDKTNKWYSYKSKKTKFMSNRFASKIKGFKNGNDTIRTVYNITVENDHTYIVNGIAVHNCQGFSLAGKQKGLDDERSVLALSYIRLLAEMQPKWFVWENVPGVLSTNGGQDFKQFIGKINEVGYCCAWRCLNSEYVRVDGFPRAIPQRRRRLFVVGHIGDDWKNPIEVLFEPESVSGNNPPKRIKGKGFTSCS